MAWHFLLLRAAAKLGWRRGEIRPAMEPAGALGSHVLRADGSYS